MSAPQPVEQRRPTRRLIARLAAALLDLYAALLVIYLLLRLAVGDAFVPVALASQAIHLLLMPTWVAFPLALGLRRWPTAAALGLHVAVFLALFGPLLAPKTSAPPDETAPVLTVMALNVEGGRHTTPETLAAALRGSGADIVGLVEFSGALIPALAQDLPGDFPYLALDAVPGKGLLSRYPIVAVEELDLSNWHVPTLLATLEVAGSPLRVIVTHVAPRGFGPDAEGEIAALAALTTAAGPGILLWATST